jgi:hypothetical protein
MKSKLYAEIKVDTKGKYNVKVTVDSVEENPNIKNIAIIFVPKK